MLEHHPWLMKRGQNPEPNRILVAVSQYYYYRELLFLDTHFFARFPFLPFRLSLPWIRSAAMVVGL